MTITTGSTVTWICSSPTIWAACSTVLFRTVCCITTETARLPTSRKKPGLQSVFTTIGSCWGDYNNDGYPDLFISSGLGRPQLFRNNRDGTFTDVSREAGITDPVVRTTCFFADYNNDGWLDIVQFSWSDHEDAIYTMKTGHGPEDGAPLVVYRNNGDGTFTAKTREVGLDGCWGTMAGNFADVNNDGYIDLLLGNGSPRMERLEPFILLENDRGRFQQYHVRGGPAVSRQEPRNELRGPVRGWAHVDHHCGGRRVIRAIC